MKLLLWFVICCLMVMATYTVSAQDTPRCLFHEGVYDRSEYYDLDDVYPRFEPQRNRIVLTRWQGLNGEVIAEFSTPAEARRAGTFYWSPHCRYFFALVDSNAMIWDMTTGLQVDVFEDVPLKNPPYWNPDESRLIVETRRGTFLWKLGDETPILLTFSGEHPSRTIQPYYRWQVEWDNTTQEVFVAPFPGEGVIAYDQNTGQERFFYHHFDRSFPIRFSFSPDRSKLILFTSKLFAYNHPNEGITIWDRNTREGFSVDTHYWSPHTPAQVAMSPDNRYLATADWENVWVWDLHHLPTDVSERHPVYLYNAPQVQYDSSVRFIDNTTMEIKDWQGNISLWHVQTGRIEQ